MPRKKNTTTRTQGTCPAEESAEALTGHITAVLHHPLTPKNLYDEVTYALDELATMTEAIGHPDCVRIIMHAALAGEKVGGRKQFVDLREKE